VFSAEGREEEAIAMDGMIADGDVGPTQMRLIKQANGEDDPRAVAWMQRNPSDFQIMFEKWLPAISTSLSGGSDEEAIAALGENEQIVLAQGMAQGMMIRTGLVELAKLGLTDVKLDIADGCYVATGIVPSPAKKKDVDTLLASLVSDFKACNLTTLASDSAKKVDSTLSKAASTGYDFGAEFAKPKQLLSAIAPGTTLSVKGSCLLLEGKVASDMHKMMLSSQLENLATELSKKSGKALKPCDKTSL
jgi:hypothetical protein